MVRHFILIPAFFLVPLLFHPAAGSAADPTVEEIVARTDHMAYYKGKDGRAQVSMTITDEQGRERHRQFTILRLDEQADDSPDQSGAQYYYVYFHRPADVNKTVFMVWKHIGEDDDRWLYLPALDLVKRIAASDERTSFVGSHFFYEDVSGRGTEEDTHKLIETTQTYYVLENIPKKPDLVEFASYKMWIHKDTYLPVKIEYFDREGKSYRVYQALEVQEIEGYQTVVRASMEDSKIGGKTVMTYDRVRYNIGLPRDIFSERYLRQPPRQYLR
jgi:outer membrane lipoprotein-sorting protein